MWKLISLTFLVAFVASCSRSPSGPPIDHQLSIHLLKDSTIGIDAALSRSLYALELKDTAWLSDKDMRYYDFSSHCIYLQIEKSDLFPTLEKGMFPMPWWARPFVFTVDGEKRYLGVFHGGLSSNEWPVPYIEDFDNLRYPKDIIHISWVWLLHAEQDKRHDEFVKGALQQLGLYRAGLTVSLDWAAMMQNSDTATIRYQFTLTNNDDDNLYIVDPDLMGTGLFHFYNNGPTLVNRTTSAVYRSDLKTVVQPEPFTSWDSHWFVRLRSRDSLTRVVTLRGYPYIPPGEYLCEFTFNGPVNIEANERLLSDGRYWIGPAISNSYTLITQ